MTESPPILAPRPMPKLLAERERPNMQDVL